MSKTNKEEYTDWLNTKVLQRAAVVDEAGNMLALKRTDIGPASRPGKWDLPGGSIDPRDLEHLADDTKPHIEAIRREIVEETGLEPAEIRATFFDSWTFQRSPGTILGLGIGYQVKVKGVKPPIQRSDEHTAAIWGSREQLLALDYGDDGGLHCSVIRAT